MSGGSDTRFSPVYDGTTSTNCSEVGGMSTYDDPINAAKRILLLNKDEPWAKDEIFELMPLVLEAYEELENRLDEIGHL